MDDGLIVAPDQVQRPQQLEIGAESYIHIFASTCSERRISQELTLSTLAEMAADFFKFKLRAETPLLNTAKRNLLAGEERRAFLNVAEGQDPQPHLISNDLIDRVGEKA
ncbi:hypothetical protein QN382_13535 [Pseudomonas sp. 10B1]|uniref:hypothetical protein n=1 Tax=unclassified Pseudomonas TaxID=196821 RepID=UPI002B22B2A8|nr:MULTISPECIES: hypothetical protein [unclassified Pseudomonas]MEA9977302.1 hypothetical protein [Pseudomonas sp. RTS4]MEA9994012.1 hypothetical protein [Pseudomonas sp. AA4]MEB0088653.1 hypothetical protein [Pseudomonas sp. RTI1]MEB0124370.1 hypothetical protein [Pseudomonas sp. CCC1.2]MEB0151864.1 hypothetical protein [Pseudomonas sp. CCC4.3]